MLFIIIELVSHVMKMFLEKNKSSIIFIETWFLLRASWSQYLSDIRVPQLPAPYWKNCTEKTPLVFNYYCRQKSIFYHSSALFQVKEQISKKRSKNTPCRPFSYLHHYRYKRNLKIHISEWHQRSVLFRTLGLYYSHISLNFLHLFHMIFHIHANVSLILTQTDFWCKAIDYSVFIWTIVNQGNRAMNANVMRSAPK